MYTLFFAKVLNNATSNIAPEHAEARKATMVEGNYIYNLLTIGLSRYAHFPLLVEVGCVFTSSQKFMTTPCDAQIFI